MILYEVSTWPSDLVEYLGSQHESMLKHVRFENDRMDRYLNRKPGEPYVSLAHMPGSPHFPHWAQVSLEVTRLLRTRKLRGWHCTRLIDDEKDEIARNGMTLPGPDLLRERIARVVTAGHVSAIIGKRLAADNMAGDTVRKEMLWFCFFPPHQVGQHGIERFFRRWGGEALYGSHEEDPVTGKALTKVGSPCLIEVDVPIDYLPKHTNIGEKAMRQFLLHHGYDPRESAEHEDKSLKPIAASDIVRIVDFRDPDFASLTGHKEWSPQLS